MLSGTRRVILVLKYFPPLVALGQEAAAIGHIVKHVGKVVIPEMKSETGIVYAPMRHSLPRFVLAPTCPVPLSLPLFALNNHATRFENMTV